MVRVCQDFLTLASTYTLATLRLEKRIVLSCTKILVQPTRYDIIIYASVSVKSSSVDKEIERDAHDVDTYSSCRCHCKCSGSWAFPMCLLRHHSKRSWSGVRERCSQRTGLVVRSRSSPAIAKVMR